MISPNILILRVGDVNSNFKNSVLDRIPLNSHIKPIWGYNSENCCGFKSSSNKKHNLLIDYTTRNNCYILILPNKKSGIIGIAKIKNINKRELGPLISVSSSNEENGWNNTTCYGHDSWNYELIIEKYWDFSKLFSSNGLEQFSYSTLFECKGKRLTQSSIHTIEEGSELFQHLHFHCSYIINFMKPDYDEK